MQLPTVDDVNATRLTRFDDQITQALTQPERIDFFRDVVSHYVSKHDVTEVDVAAALAAVMHGEQPLLLEPEPERTTRSFDERPTHGGKAERQPARDSRSGVPMAGYRIEVGKRHKVEPRQIVGALANEGGLSRQDFGYISIKPDFSVVELPATLPPGTLERLVRQSQRRLVLLRRRLQGQEPPLTGRFFPVSRAERARKSSQRR